MSHRMNDSVLRGARLTPGGLIRPSARRFRRPRSAVGSPAAPAWILASKLEATEKGSRHESIRPLSDTAPGPIAGNVGGRKYFPAATRIQAEASDDFSQPAQGQVTN